MLPKGGDMRFANREEAGVKLAKRLWSFRGTDAIVLALPRGGAIVGAIAARELGLPLGLALVCKMGYPGKPECAAGAVAEQGIVVYDAVAIEPLPSSWRHMAEKRARHILRSRRQMYYGDSNLQPEVKGRTVLLVDDGMATGLCMDAAVLWAREQGASRVVVAVPVASPESAQRLAASADKVIIVDNPMQFGSAVGAHYDYFPQIVDEEVQTALQEVCYGI